MLISQGFNLETGDMATFLEHCKRSETTENIAADKFSYSDKESDTKRQKKCSKFKEREENSKKHRKKNSSLAEGQTVQDSTGQRPIKLRS